MNAELPHSAEAIKAIVAKHCRAVRDDPEVYREMVLAVPALTGLGAAAIPSLIAMLGDENEIVSLVARSALIAMGRPALSFAIQALRASDTGQRQSACFILDDFATRDRAFALSAIPPLIGAIEDEDVSVRQRAIIALAHFRGAAAEALPLLVEALTDDDRRVAEAAAFALGRIAPRSRDVGDVLYPLRHAAENDPSSAVRAEAAKAINRINRMTGQ